MFVSPDSKQAVIVLVKALVDGAKGSWLTLTPHLVVLRQEFYHAYMLPAISELAFSWLRGNLHFAPAVDQWIREDSLAVGQTYAAVSAPIFDCFLQFLSGCSTRAVRMKGCPDGSERTVDSAQAEISHRLSSTPLAISYLILARDIVRCILPHLLSKTNCVHYGLLRLSADGLRRLDTNKPGALC